MGNPKNILAYNIYIALVLEYVCQLVEPSPEVIDSLAWTPRRLALGAGNWIMQEDLENLCNLRVQQEFPLIEICAFAAKLRVAPDRRPNAAELKISHVATFLEEDQRPLGA